RPLPAPLGLVIRMPSTTSGADPCDAPLAGMFSGDRQALPRHWRKCVPTRPAQITPPPLIATEGSSVTACSSGGTNLVFPLAGSERMFYNGSVRRGGCRGNGHIGL